MAELRLELRHAGFQTALCGGLQEARGMSAVPPSLRPTSPCHSLTLFLMLIMRGNAGRGGGGEGRVDEGSHGVSWWVTPPHQAPSAAPVCSRGISCSVDHTACACGSSGCGGTQSSWGFILEGGQGPILHLHAFLPLESEDPLISRLHDGPRPAGAGESLDSCPWLPHPSNGDNKPPDFLAKRMKIAFGCAGWAGLHRSRFHPS